MQPSVQIVAKPTPVFALQSIEIIIDCLLPNLNCIHNKGSIPVMASLCLYMIC